MGIYIPGIEMPKGHNYVTITIWPSGTVSFGLFDREENLCDFKSIKAAPVPPHGRCIDANSKTFPTPHRNPSNEYMKGWNACLRSVQQQPTVIPAEPAREEKT